MKRFYFFIIFLLVFANSIYSQTVNPTAVGLPITDYTTWFTGTGNHANGWYSSGLGTVYGSGCGAGIAGSKFDDQGDYMTVHFNAAPNQLSFYVKGNGVTTPFVFSIKESADGSTWTTVDTYNTTAEISGCQSYSYTLLCTSRYVAWVYTTKAAGNMEIDDVSITAGACAACSKPTKASAVSFSGVSTTGLTTSWTGGNGYGDVVVISTSNTAPTPTGGTTYNANTVYGSGDLMGAGYYTVYNGTGTSVAITGLTCNTTYYIYVFEYNNTGTSSPCYTTSATSNTITSACGGGSCASTTALVSVSNFSGAPYGTSGVTTGGGTWTSDSYLARSSGTCDGAGAYEANFGAYSNHTANYLQVKFAGIPAVLSFSAFDDGNSSAYTYTVQESPDGSTWNNLAVLANASIPSSCTTFSYNLNSIAS